REEKDRGCEKAHAVDDTPPDPESAAWAAARRATATRNGAQETYSSPPPWKKPLERGSPPCSPQTPTFRPGFASRPRFVASKTSSPTPGWSSVANGSSGRIPALMYAGRKDPASSRE